MVPKSRVIVIISVITLSFNTAAYCGTEKTDTYKQLESYLNTIKIVNTHEHQMDPSFFGMNKHNFYFVLYLSHYLKADLTSAGAPELTLDMIEKHNLDQLWEMYGKYLKFCRNTTFYRQFLYGFQSLYHFKDDSFTRENIKMLSAKIHKNYKNYDSWFNTAFKKSGYSIMFNDQIWNAFNTDINEKYFALVLDISDLVHSISEYHNEVKKGFPFLNKVYETAEKEKFNIKTLDDYLSFADFVFKQFIDHKAVSIKNWSAYTRSLNFEYVPYEKAKILFNKNSLTEEEKKNLQDFMFHWIIKKSITVDLPIQIHTGYLAMKGNLENTRPVKLNPLFMRYPKARFVLFHGGYPWMGEVISLSKMFPNVYLDLVWLPQISRIAAIRTFHEILDCVPYNKIFWGGDCVLIEESAGSLQIGKEVILLVLEERINKGLMTKKTAKDVIQKIFCENAVHVFKLYD